MSLLGEIKSAAEMIQKADNIELYRKILDLQAEAMSILENETKLKEENRALRNQLDITEKLVFKNNMYFLKGDTDPFCSKCWDTDTKLVRLHGYGGEGYVQCPSCKNIADYVSSNQTPVNNYNNYLKW